MEEGRIQVRYKRLDPVNLEYFKNYNRHLTLHNLQDTSIDSRLWNLYTFVKWLNNKDLKKVVPTEIEQFYLERKQDNDVTAFGIYRDLKIFYKWLLPGSNLITFAPKRPRREIRPEKVATADHALQLMRVCENQRDRALVATTWDSAARLSELLDTNIGHITFDRHGAVISVAGKTGRRPIRLVTAVPDLQAWLKIHPLRDNPNAPLFVTLRKRGTREFVRMNKRTVQNLFKRLRDLAGITDKKCNPHSLRHGRLSVRGRQLTEPELRQYAGWSSGSQMPAVYVHLSGRDIDNKILAVEGVQQPEEQAPDPMKPLECPRCGRKNAPDAILCDRCSMALTDEALRELETLRAMREDPDTLIEYGKWLKKKKTGRT